MITAVSASSGRRRSLFSSVVLPLPRKPVSTVTGMRCSAAVCVSLISSLYSRVEPPEAVDLPEFLPRPLELAAPALAARSRLPGQGLERGAGIFAGTRRRREIRQHLDGHRAVVQGAQGVLQAHRSADISLRLPGRKGGRGEGRLQEIRRIAQFLDGDAQPVQPLLAERTVLAATLHDLGVALVQHGAGELVEPLVGAGGRERGESVELAMEALEAGARERRAGTLEM